MELQKLRFLNLHILMLALVVGVLIVILAFYGYSSNSLGQRSGGQMHWKVWPILIFYCNHIAPIFILMLIAYQIGREFDWRTIHQMYLKGQTAQQYVLSKLIVYAALSAITFIALVLVCQVALFIIPSGESTQWDVLTMQLLSGFVYMLFSVIVAVFMGIVFNSPVLAMILSLLYWLIFEALLVNVIMYLADALKSYNISLTLKFTPLQVIKQLADGSIESLDLVIAAACVIAYSTLLIYLSVRLLKRKELALIV
jgi:ABC-type transport system involved in multi-copper enzyme maturation permease subunit